MYTKTVSPQSYLLDRGLKAAPSSAGKFLISKKIEAEPTTYRSNENSAASLVDQHLGPQSNAEPVSSHATAGVKNHKNGEPGLPQLTPVERRWLSIGESIGSYLLRITSSLQPKRIVTKKYDGHNIFPFTSLADNIAAADQSYVSHENDRQRNVFPNEVDQQAKERIGRYKTTGM